MDKVTLLEQKVRDLETIVYLLYNSSSIPHEVEQAFRTRLAGLVPDIPDELALAPLTAITSPSGGVTVDSQARTAIDTIITRLESLGLVSPN